MGNRISGRTPQRRTHQGDKDLIPLPANTVQPRPFTGTEPDCTVEPGTAGRIQRILCQSFHRHFIHPIRKRRPDARSTPVRRLRNCLLCILPGNRKANPVLRCTLQSGKSPVACHQWRTLRKHRYSYGEKHPRTDQRHVEIRGSDGQL